MSYIGNVKVDSTTHLVGSTLYGTCSTGAGTQAKVVTCTNFDKLLTGVTIHVKFDNTNTIADPTLNVNSTGAKAIKRYGTTAPSTTASTSWNAGQVVSFTYDGTYWMMNDFNLDTDVNTHRAINVDGTAILANNTTTALNLKSGSNVSISATSGSGDVTINAVDTNVHRCTMDSSSTATAFVVNSASGDNITALTDGLTIYVRNTVIASASGCTLKLNSLDAKRIWCSQSNGYCTTHWAKNQAYMFIYNATDQVWELQQGRDTDSTTTNATQIQLNSNALKAGSSALVAGNIIVAGSDGLYKHLKAGTAFDITYPIVYLAKAVAASATTNDVYTEINFTVTTTQSITLTAQKPVYIKGTLDGKLFTPISTAPLTQTVPTTADGYYYMYLGYGYTTTAIRLQTNHPIYAYKNGKFGQIVNDALSVNGHTIATNVPSNADLTAYSGTAPIAVSNHVISHNNSGVTAGTYKSVTVDAKGHVTAGTNPTTLSGYGITDAKIADGTITLGSNTITPLTASSNLKEAYLSWGGRNFTGNYGCIDAAMVDELGANRLAFADASGITIEYTRDGGTTWTDYGATASQKRGLFTTGETNFTIGKADTSHLPDNNYNYQLRVTLATGAAKIYTALNKFVFYVNTSSSSDCQVKIQKALQSTPDDYSDHTDWIPISGWSGYNVVNCTAFTTYGNQASSQYGRVRFIFRGKGGNSTYLGLKAVKILGFGGVGWTTPSTMAKTGHLYAFDASQNATFPAGVKATSGFTGDLTGDVTGNADTATTASKLSNTSKIGDTNKPVYFTANGVPSAISYTINKNVPSDADMTAYTGTGLISVNNHVISTTATDNIGTVTQVKVGTTAYNPSNGIISLPAYPTNTDAKVAQTATSTSANYEVLFSETADNTTRTEGARKASNLKFNPNTGNLQATQLNGVAIGTAPKFTDASVTAVGNHYTPTEDSTATLSADASGGSAATWNSTQLVTGVDIKRDAKGHVTGVAVDSIKLPSNPNVDTKF